MPDPNEPSELNLPNSSGESAPSPVDEAQAGAMLGAAEELNAEELDAATNATRLMTGATGGGGIWQPPTVEEAASLFPNYEVLALLGRGGMGAVYKARQIELDRLVAIKLLPLEISADPDFADRFRREARAMAKLSHPNIITVHDFGTTSAGHLYFAMEFIEGANLHQIIHGPGVAPPQALGIIIGVCEALAYAHSKGVVHRDIKPANVMVSTDGQVKVADFGLARLTDPAAEQMGHTMTGTVMGTPDYMAPEQMRGMNVDHRADIYSLGVMLYEMLCKDVPRGFFDPPSQRAGVDARLDDVVKRAMQQQPERRYQQTAEMRADVEQVRTAMVQPTPSLVAAVGQAPRSPTAAGGAPALQSPSAPLRKSKHGLVFALAAAVLVLGSVVYFALKQKSATGVPPVKTAQTTVATPVPLPAPKTPSLEPAAIKLWDTPELLSGNRGARVADGVLIIDGARGGLVSYSGKPSRDAILRASLRTSPELKNASLRLRAKASAKITPFYMMGPGPNENLKGVTLYYSEDGKLEKLKEWPLPRTYGPDDWMRLELHAIGEELSVVVDGQKLGTVRDNRLLTPGGPGIFADAATVRDVEYVPLDKSASTAAPAASPVGADSWQPLITAATVPPHLPGKREWSDQRLHLLFNSVNAEKPQADGAIRARIRFQDGSRSVGLVARSTSTGEGYKLNVLDRTSVSLNVIGPAGQRLETLGRHTFPKPLATGDSVTLELRVKGDQLTGLLNGTAVIEARDTRYPDAGTWGIVADDGWFETAEFQPLATMAAVGQAPRLPTGNAAPPAGGAPALQPAAPEPWQDLLAVGGWPAPFSIENGVLTRPAKTMAQRKWEGSVRDCAWRVTRRWDGGWYDLQLGLRSRGNTGVRLEFLDLPQPDVLLVRITSNKQKLAEGKTTRRYKKGDIITIEFRAVGTRITASIDGELLATAEDQTTTSGAYDFWSNYGEAPAFTKVEFLNLDGAPKTGAPVPASAPSSSSSATKDAPFVNTLGMKFVPVPILDGPTKGHRVLFSIWETRERDYEAFVNDTNRVWFDEDASKRKVAPKGPDFPAIWAGREDAQAFCAWLTERERKAGRISASESYRLPTDYEWGCAAGIGDRPDQKQPVNQRSKQVGTPWSIWPPPSGAGNFGGEELVAARPASPHIAGYRDGFVERAPVGSFPADSLGLFDLMGNVQEWVEDDLIPGEGILRGGSCFSPTAPTVDRAWRFHTNPIRRADESGFRVVLAPAQ